MRAKTVTGTVRRTKYFTNAASNGSVMRGQLPFAIAVLESPHKPLPIGVAKEIGQTSKGVAVWQLRVHGQEISGEFVLADGEFTLAESTPR